VLAPGALFVLMAADPPGASMTTSNGRTADHPISPIFLDRWSPRGFTGEPISDTDLATLFEAARWAPSSSNQQPWRFLYARRDSPDWALFFDPLFDGNKGWASSASALIAIASKRTIPAKGDKPARENYNHSFDTGAAWACLALQASLMGWSAHAMGGFDVPRAIADLGMPDDYRLECIVAVGRYQAPADDPARPNQRSPQAAFVRAGRFA
jgi:nitroreductase